MSSSPLEAASCSDGRPISRDNEAGSQIRRRTGRDSQDLDRDSHNPGLGDCRSPSTEDRDWHSDSGSSGTCSSQRRTRLMKYGRAPQNAGWYKPNRDSGGSGSDGALGGTAVRYSTEGAKQNGGNGNVELLWKGTLAIFAEGTSGRADEEKMAVGNRGFGITGSCWRMGELAWSLSRVDGLKASWRLCVSSITLSRWPPLRTADRFSFPRNLASPEPTPSWSAVAVELRLRLDEMTENSFNSNCRRRFLSTSKHKHRPDFQNSCMGLIFFLQIVLRLS